MHNKKTIKSFRCKICNKLNRLNKNIGIVERESVAYINFGSIAYKFIEVYTCIKCYNAIKTN